VKNRILDWFRDDAFVVSTGRAGEHTISHGASCLSMAATRSRQLGETTPVVVCTGAYDRCGSGRMRSCRQKAQPGPPSTSIVKPRSSRVFLRRSRRQSAASAGWHRQQLVPALPIPFALETGCYRRYLSGGSSALAALEEQASPSEWVRALRRLPMFSVSVVPPVAVWAVGVRRRVRVPGPAFIVAVFTLVG
jgi:hypothetical protein